MFKLNTAGLDTCLAGKKRFNDQLKKISEEISSILPNTLDNDNVKKIVAIDSQGSQGSTLWNLKKILYAKFPHYNIMTFRNFADSISAIQHYSPDIIVLSANMASDPLAEIISFIGANVKIIIIDSSSAPLSETPPNTNSNVQTIERSLDPKEVESAFG